MATQEELKRIAAQKAVEFVPEDEYIGIGTGTTVNCFIEALAASGKKIKGAVSTSKETSAQLAKYNIPEVTLSDVVRLTVYVDGADLAGVEPRTNMQQRARISAAAIGHRNRQRHLRCGDGILELGCA